MTPATPPTMAEALKLAMEALALIGYLDAHKRFCVTNAQGKVLCSDYCPIGIARRALAALEGRRPLREDVELAEKVAHAFEHVRGICIDAGDGCGFCDEALDAIEAHLLGPTASVPRGETP